MAIWFQIAIILNILYWVVFFYLLSRRRWNVAALAVGIFHMLFAAVVSVAPIRSLLDPDYPGYALGVLHFEKRAVVIPATLILCWALTAAWTTVGRGTGRWMKLVMLGDFFFSLNLGISILLDDSQNWKFQLGEYFTATGRAGLLILLGLFTVPFIVSGIWAARRTQAGGTAPPLASNKHERGSSKKEGERTNGFRYSESHV